MIMMIRTFFCCFFVNCSVMFNVFFCPRMVPRSSQKGPKIVPKRSQNGPKMVAKTRPKWSQNRSPGVLKEVRSEASILGRFWISVGPHLGAILGLPWAILGPSWHHLGAILGHLGAIWGHFGRYLQPSWGSLRHPGASVRHIGAILRHLGPSWPHFGSIFVPFHLREPRFPLGKTYICVIYDIFISYVNLGLILVPIWRHFALSCTVLGPSWGHLGPSWDTLGPSWAILAPSWGHLGPILRLLAAKPYFSPKILNFGLQKGWRNLA